MDPRPYQLAAIDGLRANIRKGIRKQLLVMPTGTGKTLTASTMIKSAITRGRRVLFVAHRLELIDQTVRTMHAIGVGCGVIRGNDYRRDKKQPVQVASVATLRNRQKPEADLVFIDEAHRALAKSYVAHVLEAYPNAIHVGLTATPCRSDGRPLGTMYSAIVQAITYEQAIAEGYLSAPRVFTTPKPPDLSHVKTTAGDYDRGELAIAMNENLLMGDIIEHWKKRAEGRRTVVFASGLEHSTGIVARFIAAGIRAEHLDGTTPEEQRKAILARLESGETHVVSNVGVLCEGWDMPACKCLVLARPTKSLSLFMQMGGRIFRPWEGIEPLILDHASNVKAHGLPHMDRTWSLEERIKTGKGEALTKECHECFARIFLNLTTCPHCGASFEPDEDERSGRGEKSLTEAEGELVEVKPPTIAQREAFFDDAVTFAVRKGLKPGWVWHRYFEVFHVQMPNTMWSAVKRAMTKAKEEAA